ncbi:DEAD/DEAH box helicase [Alicyclobacillus contaminans]|uniref:helicase-related protein n=1 Tax=Alicyclobacillus contaminans TaxID=392016 RepID=UPI0004791DE4|nr:DEAD/DEAH box helicase [Alicyclobacillus contaminans]
MSASTEFSLSAYFEFLATKSVASVPTGIDVQRSALHPKLFDFQRDIVRWALKRGKAAIFAHTGLGKTLMQLEWANQVQRDSGGKVLILAPLAVSNQTAREAEKIDLTVHVCRDDSDVRDGLNITNYERLHRFDPEQFTGIVLDESSLLKAYDGKMRNIIIDSFKRTPFKLACTATPAPNDYMELGNHSEFLGIMTRSEMLSMFFVHDGGNTSQWRLKGHAVEKFWEWVASWAVLIRKPSDLGYEDGDFLLPPLNIDEIVLPATHPPEGYLIPFAAQTLQERRHARSSTIAERVAACADIVNATDKPFLVWCDLNAESEALRKAIPDSVEVKGSDSSEHKEKAMLDFADGKIRVLVTKPSIAGFGMNWQHCSDMAFVGLSDSFEQMFQAIRRCYRFGQKNPVNVHIITSELEGAVLDNVKRKEAEFEAMAEAMSWYTQAIVRANIRSAAIEKTEYTPQVDMKLPDWLKGDAV